MKKFIYGTDERSEGVHFILKDVFSEEGFRLTDCAGITDVPDALINELIGHHGAKPVIFDEREEHKLTLIHHSPERLNGLYELNLEGFLVKGLLMDVDNLLDNFKKQ